MGRGAATSLVLAMAGQDALFHPRQIVATGASFLAMECQMEMVRLALHWGFGLSITLHEYALAIICLGLCAFSCFSQVAHAESLSSSLKTFACIGISVALAFLVYDALQEKGEREWSWVAPPIRGLIVSGEMSSWNAPVPTYPPDYPKLEPLRSPTTGNIPTGIPPKATSLPPFSATAEGGYKIKLLFKDSPLFSVARKAAITREINDFYEYLVELGFDPPADVPPIAALIGESSDVAGMWSSPRNAKFLTLFVGSKVFDNPEIIRLGYAKYAFDTILFRRYPDDFFNRKSFLDVYAEYFAASFSGVEPEKPVWSPEWVTALWEIRGMCGKSFTDRSLMHALSFLDDPNFGAGGPFNTFFYLRFRYGEGVVDNDGKKTVIADQILEKRGLWKAHTN